MFTYTLTPLIKIQEKNRQKTKTKQLQVQTQLHLVNPPNNPMHFTSVSSPLSLDKKPKPKKMNRNTFSLIKNNRSNHREMFLNNKLHSMTIFKLKKHREKLKISYRLSSTHSMKTFHFNQTMTKQQEVLNLYEISVSFYKEKDHKINKFFLFIESNFKYKKQIPKTEQFLMAQTPT